MTTAPHTGFRDPTELTKWTKWFLYASLPLVAGQAFAAWREYWWLRNTGQAAPSFVVESLGPVLALGLLLTVVLAGIGLMSSILVLSWIHRANYNARQLGATGLKFTPGWAVGWYFIPIAMFWKPYQAMKEIWQASFNPTRWWEEEKPPLLPLWWGLWLVTSFVTGSVTWGVEAETASAASEGFRALLRIPLTLILIHIINQVHRMQMANFRARSAE